MSRIIDEMWEQSIRKGIEIGDKKRQRITAQRALADGRYSLEEIAHITELSLDEVAQLKAEQKA